jgi:predicted NBD/HSP70 family sugar kinase
MQTKPRYDRRDIRQLNTVSVLNQLRTKGALSRAQIAAELGLTRATVSNIVVDLLNASLLKETEYTEGGGGRPGLLLTINGAYGCMVAVEIDLDCISVAVADFSQTIFWREERLLRETSSAIGCLEVAANLITEALQQGAGRELECSGIGVAWAGLVGHEEGRLVYGPISGWEDIPLKADWEARFKVPVYIENEAYAAAVGVRHAGIREGESDLIYLSLGVGLAAGIITGGVLLRGRQGYAGQVGHMHFLDNGITCGCGKSGCWVTEVGALALKRKLAAKGLILPADWGSGIDWLDLVHKKALSGDVEVLQVLQAVGRQVGQGVAQLVQTFNPSTLVVGGRMGKVMRVVEPVIRETISAGVLPDLFENVELIVSDCEEDPLFGCMATIYDSVMANPVLNII